MDKLNYFERFSIDIDATEEEIRRILNTRIRDLQGLVNSRDQKTREQAEADLKILFEARRVLLDSESRNNLITEIKKQGLVEKTQQKMKETDRGASEGLIKANFYSIALLIDTSGSMAGEKIEEAKKAMLSFLNKTDLTVNEVGLVEFGNYVLVVSELSRDEQNLRDSITTLKSGDGTPMLEGIKLANGTMLLGCQGRPVMVISTDGQPNEPNEDILEYAAGIKERGVWIITIGIGRDVDSEFLKQLASSPDDYHFAEASIELEKIYTSIATGLATMD